MRAEHFEILVEEPSAEAFLVEMLPKVLADRAPFTIHAHQGKSDLLAKLEARLRAYAQWLPAHMRIVVLVDRDSDECAALKAQLEAKSTTVGLSTRSSSGGSIWRVVNRIAIEELEAWFFGEWTAVKRAYPNVPATIPNKSAYRNSDDISGGTWEALERIMKRVGYFTGGLRKVELAREIGRCLDHAICNSKSFLAFRDALMEASEEPAAQKAEEVA